MNSSWLLSLMLSHVWQVSVLLLLVALLDRLFSQRWPQLVALLWISVFIKGLVPPIWASSSGFFSWVEAGIQVPGTGVPMATTVDVQPSVATGILALAAGTWALGACFTLAWISCQWLRVARQLRESQDSNAELTRKVEVLAGRLGIGLCPRVKVSDSQGPFAFGIFSPVLCLPKAMVDRNEWSELRPVVMHELVHLRRRDTWVAVLQVLVNCVWWFHPSVRWASRKLTQAIEYCVDYEVTTKCGCDSRVYAKSILRAVDLSGAQAPVFAANISSTWITAVRIRRLLSDTPTQDRAWRRWVAYSCFITALVVFLPGRSVNLNGPECSLSLQVEQDGKTSAKP